MSARDQGSERGKQSGRARLLQAARALVQERPFDEITIDDIIKQANLSRPAFYYHFVGGKEELRGALIACGTLSEAPAQDVRQMMLEAALRVFARAGLSAATLDDIAAEAGVTRGTLCWHFHSKEDLLSAIFKHYSPHSLVRSTFEQIECDLQNGVPLDDETIFRRLAGAFYDAFNIEGDHVRLAVLLLYTHPEIAQILAEKIATERKSMSNYVRKRQDEGAFRADIDPGFLVQIIAMTFAMRSISRGLHELLAFNNLPREIVINQLVSLLLYGVVRREAPVT